MWTEAETAGIVRQEVVDTQRRCVGVFADMVAMSAVLTCTGSWSDVQVELSNLIKGGGEAALMFNKGMEHYASERAQECIARVVTELPA